MEFQGRIAKVLPMRQGTSTRTGNEWYAQPFVFEYFENPTDRFADSVVLETFNTDIMPHLKEGLEVICGFGHKAKTVTKQDGTQVTINEMRLYKFESVQHANKAAGAANAPAGAQQTAAQPIAVQTAQNDANDDLPF
jgi:hypothetical protein